MRPSQFPVAATLAFGLLVPPPGGAQAGSPAGPVPGAILEARRRALLDLLDGAPAVLAGARQRDLESDYLQDSDFRQNNDFFYLTGVETPDAWLVLNGAGAGTIVLYLPPRSPRAEQWTGPTLGPGPDARALTGVGDVRPLDRLGEDLAAWIGGGDARSPARGKVLYVAHRDPVNEEALKGLLPGGVELRSLDPLLARLRLVKDEDEIRRLRRAVDITAEAHEEVWRVAAPGVAEYQLEAALEYVFQAQGAERVGFPSIVGSGPNSVILHYDKNRRTLVAGDLVVVDIGAEFGYYTADLTRTFPASGRFSPRQRALYELVLGAMDAALAVLRPGVTIQELNRAAREHFEKHSGDLCGPGSCVRFFAHGLSHWLGMDVHDVGDTREPLAPGMVLTLEPGLYLPDESLGIRIEDDVLVTETGYEILSRDLPRTVREIEAIMGQEPRWVRIPSTLEPNHEREEDHE